ncbi:phage major capsid protein, partial [Acinetobacter baumannii]
GMPDQPAATILGRPVIEMPDLPDVAAGAFPIVFGDFKQGYRVFDRLSLSILRDPYTQQTNGLVRFHARRRVAGSVAKAEAFRKLKIAA